MPKSADMRAVGEFAASRYGTFDLSQAAAAGITRNDLRRMERDGVLVRVRPSVWRYLSQPVTARQQLYAATVGVRAVASHLSAAALHQIDGFERWPERPEIACQHFSPVRVAAARVRRTRYLPAADVMEVDGIPCTTLARTICDVAGVVSHDRVVQAIDDAQRRGASMTWLMQRAALLQRTGRSGPTDVLEIVGRRLSGYRVPDSWFERLLQRCMTSTELVGLVRQHELYTDGGKLVARFDLAVPWARLGIEGHSRSFHLGEGVERYDEDRDIRAAQQGWEIAYLGFAATRAPAAVCHDIELLVRRRSLDLNLSPPTRPES